MSTYETTMSVYMLTAINGVTSCSGIHTFHIISICAWLNMAATLHIYLPLHTYYRCNITAHMSRKEKEGIYLISLSVCLSIYLSFPLYMFLKIIKMRWLFGHVTPLSSAASETNSIINGTFEFLRSKWWNGDATLLFLVMWCHLH